MREIKFLNKGKRKNLIKRNKKSSEISLQNKKGSALAETIIIVAVSLVLAISLFYPKMTQLLTNVMDRMDVWVSNTII